MKIIKNRARLLAYFSICGFIIFASFLMVVITNSGPCNAATEDPLSIHPKLGVLQRGYLMIKVVTKEKENEIHKEPSDSSNVVETVEALRIFFVFPAQDGKPELTKNDFFRISWSPRKQDIVGWVHKDNVQEWYHREMAQFNSLAGRKQALVFGSKDDLLSSLTKPDAPENKERAISREPKDASQQRQDILLPILEVSQLTIGGELVASYNIAYLHQAGVTGSGPAEGTPVSDGPVPGVTGEVGTSDVKDLLDSFKLDVLFVMDMTNSMQPVIDKSVEVVQHLAKEAKGLREGGQVRVGLVGYRDRIGDQQAMGFVVRRFSPLTEDVEVFLGKLKLVREAKVSSEDYPEAMYDGVLDAIQNTRWSENGLRVIVLIGDAEAHEPGSPKNPDNISLENLIQSAGEKRIRICPLKMILGGDIELHRKQLKALTQGIGQGVRGVYSEFDGKTGIEEYVGNMKSLLTAEANRLQELINTHLKIAEQAKQTGKITPPTPRTDADYIILENINTSAIEALMKEGRNPEEPVFSTGWIAEKQEGKDVIIPYVLMSDTELQVLDIYLRSIKAGADKSSDVWEAMMRSIEGTTGEKISVERDVPISKILEKKHDLPIKTSLLRFTFDEMRNWTPEVRTDILEKVNRKLHMLDSISNDPAQFRKQGKGYLITYVPVNYLP
jgi:serine/threonine-protein kinase PpkA